MADSKTDYACDGECLPSEDPVAAALSCFEPLPESVERQLVRLDCGDGVLNPLAEV